MFRYREVALLPSLDVGQQSLCAGPFPFEGRRTFSIEAPGLRVEPTANEVRRGEVIVGALAA